MNPYLQEILHDITTRLAKLEAIEPTVDGWPLWSGLPQPKKEWVGLTYDDMIKIWNELYKGDDVLPTTFGMAIEAKLKEKNHG